MLDTSGRESLVFIAGHLRQREYVTAEGGKRRALEVVAERVEFMSEPAGQAAAITRALIDPPVVRNNSTCYSFRADTLSRLPLETQTLV